MLTKAQVEFEHPAKGKETCGDCKYFETRHPQGCEIVEGEIYGVDWCIMHAEGQRQPYAGISGKETKS
jgi:hypothetical protein